MAKRARLDRLRAGVAVQVVARAQPPVDGDRHRASEAKVRACVVPRGHHLPHQIHPDTVQAVARLPRDLRHGERITGRRVQGRIRLLMI